MASLGAYLKRAREQKAWSQVDLALEARVSTRTIVALETGKANALRTDVIVRLARALDRDPKTCLALSGSKDVGEEKLNRAVRAAGGFRFRGEMDPGEFFSGMLDELSDSKPRLMCVCYPSGPGTNHRPDVRNLLVKALKKGLTLALVCPFPHAGASIENAEKPSLIRCYRDVYDHIILLARDLTERLPRDRKERLAVFVPQQQRGMIYWTMPPMGVSKVRQTLIKRFSDAEDEDSELQLVAWVELIQDQKDRMVEIYPTEAKDRARIEVLRCWREYLSEIIDTFDVHKGWTRRTSRRLKSWKMVSLK